jgi:hypothetical protein
MREAIETQRQHIDRFNLIGMLVEAAWIETSADDWHAAKALLDEALSIALDLDKGWGCAKRCCF